MVELLSECHARIRTFLDLARRMASTPALGAVDTRTTAAGVRRYFTVAFPLHLADEDEILIPRLRQQNAELDAALARMHADHGEHEPAVNRLVEICTALEKDPQQLPARAGELGDAVAALMKVIEPHLALEEKTIFPALAALPREIRDEMRVAMRARREPVASE
ncbi:MAG TPA: hemerythrin domain-containing protein [Kofleriaceae bacterium]|nr:hemerythrin domain-containing protein [Kofleriaceae bacterium]